MEEDTPCGDSTSNTKDDQTNMPAEEIKSAQTTEVGTPDVPSSDAKAELTSVDSSESVPNEKEVDKDGSNASKQDKMDTAEANSNQQQCSTEENTGNSAQAAKDTNNLVEKVNSEIPDVLKPPPEPVDIKIIYNKKKYDHSTDLNKTILDLKHDIEKLTGVPVATQKVMYKGSTQDEQTLKQLKVTKNAKFMVIGSTINDLLKIATPTPSEIQSGGEERGASASKEPLSKQTVHKKVLDKYGKPDDGQSGIKGARMPLPQTPVSGMYNKHGGKTRLTFKLDQDELWIGTKERTQKVKMGSIKAVVSEPIEGNEGYHIMGLQLGPTEASKYWIYWVPAQYVNAIKDTVLGQWETF